MRFGVFTPTGPRATRVSATGTDGFRPRSAYAPARMSTLHRAPTGRSPIAHPFGRPGLPGAARRSSTCVVSCSDIRCRARPATRHHPSPVSTGTTRARQFVEQRSSSSARRFASRPERLLCFTAQPRFTTTP
ncbi:hypothetical protein DC008_07050 [Streptomyces nigra]|nr:hypothetical protein DC008_07050 [Streptomyces nigra]